MKKINLEEIFEKTMLENPHFKAGRWIAIRAMREACNQALALAAEEQAKYYSELGFTSTGKKINDSILNLKQQII